MRDGERERGREGEGGRAKGSQRDKNRDTYIQIERVCVCAEGIYSESESE